MFKHLKNNNETYVSHMLFAGKISLNLLVRGVFFLLHAFIPLWDMPARLNLKSLKQKTHDWNAYAKQRLKKSKGRE